MSIGRQRVAVLGSTGSIGTQTLDLITQFEDRFEIVGLGAGHWSAALARQVRRWEPELVAVARKPGDEDVAGVALAAGEAALEGLVERLAPDIVVLGTPGLVGLQACLLALRQGARVLVANKEPLVSAGDLVCETARTHGGTILPVDSEHSGVWQCLRGEEIEAVHRIVLTTSGGALRDVPMDDLAGVKPAQALRHPTWSMGPKITIDSATLMNKGLEIIEASWLFGVPPSMISVMVHRQSLVHAAVEFRDGSIKAQLSTPDMRFPLLHALVYPERPSADLPTLDLLAAGGLTFEPVDDERYPALHLAREAAEAGVSYPVALNAANEVAVKRFLAGEIHFTQIVPVVKRTLELHQPEKDRSLPAILAVDDWARGVAQEMDLEAEPRVVSGIHHQFWPPSARL